MRRTELFLTEISPPEAPGDFTYACFFFRLLRTTTYTIMHTVIT